MILIGRTLFLLQCIFFVQVFYHKDVFPSHKNSFFKEKIQNIFIVHVLTLRKKIHFKNNIH